MFKSIIDYMRKSRIERRAHLDLSTSCIEIGGESRDFRGMLAHYLKTTMPHKKQAMLCHACHNAKCSNIQHLYWGSEIDNHIDYRESPNYRSVPRILKDRLGEDGYKDFLRSVGFKRKGKPANHLTDDTLAWYEQIFKSIDTTKRGWKSKIAKELGISHTHVRRLYKRISENGVSRSG